MQKTSWNQKGLKKLWDNYAIVVVQKITFSSLGIKRVSHLLHTSSQVQLRQNLSRLQVSGHSHIHTGPNHHKWNQKLCKHLRNIPLPS